MALRTIDKPATGEYPPYAEMYIGLLPDDGHLLDHMEKAIGSTIDLVRSIPEHRLMFRYEEGKWTIKEIFVHIIDDERIYGYRALSFARGDKTELPGFEQEDYADASGANERDMKNILKEYSDVRRSTISLFNGLSDQALLNMGVANTNPVSVRALAYHIAGHEMHHLNIIKQRYL
jgi:uncharacterized damage-inducible protein DinB